MVQIILKESAVRMDNQGMLKKIFWNWDIHYACNYRCSYCFLAGKWEISAEENRYPGIKKWIGVWDRIHDKYGSCHIHFSGGEPFIYPDFFDLIVYLSEKHTLEFSTNLSFDVNHFIKKMNPMRVKLDVSFHLGFASFEEFSKKVSLLKENGFFVSVSFVAYPPHLEKMKILKDKFTKKGIHFIVQPFRGEYVQRLYPNSYTESEKESIKSCGGNLPVNKTQINYHLNKKQKEVKLCHMGRTYGKIYAGADVYRCCSPGAQKLGNLLDNVDFKLLDGPEPCEVEDCVCWRRMVVGEEYIWLDHWNYKS